jgi:hypothetical protein
MEIGKVKDNSSEEVGGVNPNFLDGSFEEPIISLVVNIRALERNSSNHIGGFESNCSNIIERVVFKYSEFHEGNVFNSPERIRGVSNNSSYVFREVILKASDL